MKGGTMPNIQICGYPPTRAEELRMTVNFALNRLKLDLDTDGVISIVPLEVRTCSGLPSPYLRICSTDPDEIWSIIRELQRVRLGEDVEYLVLGGFIPAKEMGKT